MLIVPNVSVIVISNSEKLGAACLHNNGMEESDYECVNYHAGPAMQLLAMTHILIYGSSKEKTQNCFVVILKWIGGERMVRRLINFSCIHHLEGSDMHERVRLLMKKPFKSPVYGLATEWHEKCTYRTTIRKQLMPG